MNVNILTTPPLALKMLIRKADTHKGMYGNVAIIGGAPGMIGAALLAGRAALHLGAGRVHIGLLKSKIAVDFMQPELMMNSPQRLINNDLITHLLIGPGLSQSRKAKYLISESLNSSKSLIIDADGLNIIANNSKLQRTLKHRQAETIITPHPAEAARLLNCELANIQSNRQSAVIQLFKTYQCGVILKGHNTLIMASGDIIHQNTSGNSALSNAGQGDVLGGIILSLWAQGLSLINASCSGVFLHGQAADLWRTHNANRIGLTASQVIELAKSALNNFILPTID
ncbi:MULTISPECIES: NAD(P)H-hydrate dehydratase [Deefgea]|uniref:ADP-dependent (S)-NAD(P)H-hydrate dehydratase n=1 Tax=Deefgea chitinilytica TaxID=570276 RepID=A0ABS2CF78_9NEIS|nr:MULTISPECIES: NAD(P)H-hydrate dehydratase [Deefgea]MBM5572795.1 NAD(P)H-hydrate dehydratase [Deefgea chitinilytica]MBM9890032.1 NAD(P)H-hydrate dehydratase [Deefgea sp. CFH1-16]